MSEETTTEKTDEILALPMPEGMTRMESGPVRFGDDWPGFFLRGDSAMACMMGLDWLDHVLKSKRPLQPSDELMISCNLGRVRDFKRCIVGGREDWIEPGPWEMAEELLLSAFQITEIEVRAHTRDVSPDGMVSVPQHTGDCTVEVTAAGTLIGRPLENIGR